MKMASLGYPGLHTKNCKNKKRKRGSGEEERDGIGERAGERSK